MNIRTIFSILLLFIAVTGCTKSDGEDDDFSYLESIGSGDQNSLFDISQNNSGLVKITPIGEGVTRFIVDYGISGVNAVTLDAGDYTTYNYPEGSYTVKITSVDLAGNQVVNTYPLQITYIEPEDIEVNRTVSGYTLTVQAEALYAHSFTVYYGDVEDEVGAEMPLDHIDNDYTGVGITLPAHTYPSAGVYNLRVVAHSGGLATSEVTIPVTIYDPFELPISFENPNVNYFFGTFGNVVFQKVSNPDPSGINTSDTVGKYIKPSGAASWSGTYSPLTNPIDFSTGNKIKVKIYASEVGKQLNVELEYAVGGTPVNGVAVLKVANTVANQWEELTFDFSTISGIPADAKFTQLVLRYNDTQVGNDEVIYLDDFQLIN